MFGRTATAVVLVGMLAGGIGGDITEVRRARIGVDDLGPPAPPAAPGPPPTLYAEAAGSVVGGYPSSSGSPRASSNGPHVERVWLEANQRHASPAQWAAPSSSRPGIGPVNPWSQQAVEPTVFQQDISGRGPLRFAQRPTSVERITRNEGGAAVPNNPEAFGLAASGPAAPAPGNVFNRLGERLFDMLSNPAEAHTAEPAKTEPLPPVPPDPTQPITLHLDDVDIRRTLEMLSREGELSILVSPGVTGRVTANIHQLSFDEALRAILKLCDLVAYHEGELIFVYDRADVPQFNRQLATFPLDYASAADVYQAVQGLLSPTGQAFQTESSPTDNRRTREMIVVEDLDVNLARIEEYIAAIDLPPRQVLIEVNVLKVELSDDMAHGVNFEQLIEWAGNTVNVQVRGFANPITPQSQGFFIDVDGAGLDGLIEALQTTTNAKTLASPRVMVLNGQEARIQIGQQLDYRVITTTETSSMEDVDFLELGIVLTVTPHITRDNQVVMDVRPKVSTGRINPTTALPEEETTEVETSILLADGRGMVIGGLIQEEDVDVQSKVPILGDLWYVGRLFQRRTVKKVRSEIIIILKPRVLPYMPDYECVDRIETQRASTPLLYGPLCKYPRPWEPALRDALHDPYPGTVPPGQVEYCSRPEGQCLCGQCP